MFARILLLIPVFVGLPALADGKCKSMERAFDAEGLERLAIEVRVGELQVSPSTDGQVHVAVRACARGGWFRWRNRSAESAALEVVRKDERMTFTLNKDRFEEDWTVSLPENVALNVDMGVGAASIVGLRNDISLDIGVGDAKIEGRAADYKRASGDAGVGEVSIDAEGGSGESERAVVAHSASWNADHATGSATIEADVGVGDIEVTLD